MTNNFLVPRFSLATLLFIPIVFSFGFFAGQHCDRVAEDNINSGEYLIIEFVSEPTLDTMVPVFQDNSISLALVGNINVADLTPPQLSERLQQMYGEFVKDPEIRVVRVGASVARQWLKSDLL